MDDIVELKYVPPKDVLWQPIKLTFEKIYLTFPVDGLNSLMFGMIIAAHKVRQHEIFGCNPCIMNYVEILKARK